MLIIHIMMMMIIYDDHQCGDYDYCYDDDHYDDHYCDDYVCYNDDDHLG